MKTAVIGTAGRKDDQFRLDERGYQKMVYAAHHLLCNQLAGTATLVSGGAAWADHVAVTLFLRHTIKDLELCFPCGFDSEKLRFVDTGERNWRDNPGGTANFYHVLFSTKTQRNSLGELAAAIRQGAHVQIESGFMRRNERVAEADAVVAFTFGQGAMLKAGGTTHTMRTYLNRVDRLGLPDRSYHVDLHDFIVYAPASVL